MCSLLLAHSVELCVRWLDRSLNCALIGADMLRRMPAAAVYQMDFSGGGDKLCPEDDYIPATCMLGLRLAARNIFCCSLRQLRLELSPESERMYTFEGVMAYLARQKRSEFQLSSTTAVLQVVTVDEVQLPTGQTKTLQHASSELPNTMIQVLASWMMAGVSALSAYCLTHEMEPSDRLWHQQLVTVCRSSKSCGCNSAHGYWS